jgi:hypothetical protein
MSRKQKALALVMAELDDVSVKGTVEGIVETRTGKVAEGDADHDELLTLIRNALDEDENENGDRQTADKKES